MKVNTFVKKVKEGQFNNAADMIKVWYIPIQTKHDIALRVLEKCSADNNGYFYVDDFEKNIYFSMLMFNAYTGVEISEDFETLLKEYDMLCSNDILDTVEQLCRKDHNHVEEVLHYEEKKLMRQNSIEASFAQIANGIFILNWPDIRLEHHVEFTRLRKSTFFTAVWAFIALDFIGAKTPLAL